MGAFANLLGRIGSKLPDGIGDPIFVWTPDMDPLKDIRYGKRHRMQPLSRQVEKLTKLFDVSSKATLDYVRKVLPSQKLHPNAEGRFAFPRWQCVAETYPEAVERVIDILGGMQGWRKDRKFTFEPSHLRQHRRTKRMLARIEQQQPGDILVVDAQFGRLHRKCSVFQVREKYTLEDEGEFGLGAFAVGCMLLTHPYRLHKNTNLFIDCPGDEVDPHNPEAFVEGFVWHPFLGTPSSYGKGDLTFTYRWSDLATHDHVGAPTAFIDESAH